MTQEDKQLSLKAICGYLPYGLIYHRNDGANIKLEEIDVVRRLFNYTDCPEERDIKPYLRPMSSMTAEENEKLKYVIELELQALEGEEGHNTVSAAPAAFEVDFYNKNHFDYRGLIGKGLALEAPEDMYD